MVPVAVVLEHLRSVSAPATSVTKSRPVLVDQPGERRRDGAGVGVPAVLRPLLEAAVPDAGTGSGDVQPVPVDHRVLVVLVG